jgi:hypothetical protein
MTDNEAKKTSPDTDVVGSRADTILLPPDAWNRFLETIEEEGKEPTDAAKRAVARYRKGRVDGDSYRDAACR